MIPHIMTNTYITY